MWFTIAQLRAYLTNQPHHTTHKSDKAPFQRRDRLAPAAAAARSVTSGVQPKLPYVVLVEKGLSLLCAKLASDADGPDALGSRAPGRPPLTKVSTGTVDFGHFPVPDHPSGCDRRTRHRTRCAAALAWHIPRGMVGRGPQGRYGAHGQLRSGARLARSGCRRRKPRTAMRSRGRGGECHARRPVRACVRMFVRVAVQAGLV